MKNSITTNLANDSVNPYYIFAPSYIHTSAGVKALHLLCHHLNLKGYPSFIAQSKELYYKTNPNLITPVATDEVLELHKKNNKTPIVVYPDVTKGNPLNSKCVVRYLLHYAGFLGGNSSFSKNELIFTYTKKIGQKMGIKDPRVLFMPICDTKIFHPPETQSNRDGSCFYASKYQTLSNNEPLQEDKSAIEISRNLPDSQTTLEVADLLRESEYFSAYEDTSLITESILCDCPAVLVKNSYFEGETLAIHELGSEGTTTSREAHHLEEARKSIPAAKIKFLSAIDNFYPQLDEFIKTTQKFSQKFRNKAYAITLHKPQKKRKPIGRVIKNRIKSFLSRD